MKTIKLFFLLLFCTIGLQTVFAQQKSFPEVGAIWHYGWLSLGGSQSYYTLEITKDSLIQSKDCFEMKLEKFDVDKNVEYSKYKYVLYEGNRIYQYYDENFYLLYDFTVEEGDTIRTTVVDDPSDFSNYSDEIVSLIDVEMEVTKVTEVEINGEMLKSYTASVIKKDMPEEPPYICVGFGGAIENVIGSYFFPMVDYACGYNDVVTFPEALRCYQNGDFLYKRIKRDCDYTSQWTSIDEYDNLQYSIYLNADNTILKLIGIEQYPVEYSITHSNGSTIANGKLSNNDIDISTLQAGVYILQINTPNSVSYKFVKK